MAKWIIPVCARFVSEQQNGSDCTYISLIALL
jgi:hypothetical protein